MLLVIATNLTLIYVKVTKIIFLCVLKLLPNKNAITKNQLKQNFYVKKNNSLITSNKKGFCFSSQIIFGKKSFYHKNYPLNDGKNFSLSFAIVEKIRFFNKFPSKKSIYIDIVRSSLCLTPKEKVTKFK